MKSARTTLAWSLAFVVSVLSHPAFAKQASVSDRSLVRSCDVTTAVKLTESELAQLTAKGYRVHHERSAFSRSRFLGTYEYYELKHPAEQTGTLYLNTILAPSVKEAVTISRREFRLMVGNGRFESLLHLATSVPPGLALRQVEAMNANFSSFPNCHD